MARKFEFSLQKVLDVRQRLQDQKVSELNKAQSALSAAEDRLTQSEREKESALSEAGKQPPLNVRTVKIRGAYFIQLDEKIINQHRLVAACKEEVSIAREALKVASKEKKTVEKLREKALAEYNRKQRSRQEMLDSEIALRKKTFEIEEPQRS